MATTDGLDQALADVALNYLDADNGPPPLVWFDGRVPPGTSVDQGYVNVYTVVEWPPGAAGDALDGVAGSPTVRWYCHCVGATAKASRGIAERVRTALLNKRPVIPGLDPGIIRMDVGGSPPQRNETTGSLVMDTVVVYRLLAVS
jgi:hypothetical protein